MDEPVWSISEVNAAVRDLLEESLTPFWLTGEIGTMVIHRSGHVYLTLKDAQCQLKAAWFNGGKEAVNLGLETGVKIEAYGKLTAYPPRGEYQFSIRSVRLAGHGSLLMQFEKIRNKLEKEGLFAPERKRPIPRYPRKVGIITAAEGAAVRDFIKVGSALFPALKAGIYPAAVQGVNAVKEVCAGLDFFNRRRDFDLIVITRGGGSMKDLWPFNDELLARKIAGSRLPVVSAVGHEIDFTIADFAADLRAPTPSAAASIIFAGYGELYDRLRRDGEQLRNLTAIRMRDARHRVERAAEHYIFREPVYAVKVKQQQLDELEHRSFTLINAAVKDRRRIIEMLNRQLNALNPFQVLQRGYAIVRDSSGNALTSGKPELIGSKITVKLAEGGLEGVVSGVIEDKN